MTRTARFLHSLLSIVLLCGSLSIFAPKALSHSLEEAEVYLKDVFPDPALRNAVLNRFESLVDWVDLNNTYSTGGHYPPPFEYVPYSTSYPSIFEFLLSEDAPWQYRLYYLDVENASSIEGIDR